MSICIMLQKIQSLWPRSKGQGWEKSKFHEQLHVPMNIQLQGAPETSHSGPTENHHIVMIKKPAHPIQ